MTPVKFIIKCGNFAVLVDLYVLPLGSQEDASWFTMDHIEEVTTLVRDAVDQRVKQYTKSLHNRRERQKEELTPASVFFVKGKNMNLMANFLKRHFNLRCISKQLYGDLRVFPERYVVCVNCPEDASAYHGNPSRAVTEQSSSEYFSRVGETQELLSSSTKTKKIVLQKLAKQASVQKVCSGSSAGEQQTDEKPGPKKQMGEAGESKMNPKETVSSSGQKVLPGTDNLPFPNGSYETGAPTTRKQDLKRKQQTEDSTPDSINPNRASGVFSKPIISQETSKRCKQSDEGEDPNPWRAKRTCLGRPPATIGTPSTESSTQTCNCDHLPLPPLPQVQAKAESKAFPVSESKKTTLEVEPLTLGKQAQRLPLTTNNMAQTNQNRLAATLRGLSVKPASSGLSISSRSTHGEEGSENVPRTSRLRRLKRS